MYTESPPLAQPTHAGASSVGGEGGGPGKTGMWTFQYKHGDRPLDGYTIQRAAGRGGFGEVYYAVSDAGREVALKVITGFEQIELRGIGHCMNLKSPHLVTIFDVRQNSEGRSFVLMEFVSGPNLRELLDAAPAGLGTQKAAFFLREIAKGLSYLHDCGIVHRDLKPANIFFENGYAKIGDYGLSKAIEPTHHSGQTVTVGTVHYMAPEVGCGKYDRSIDIYALGALLYEMLTGIVPFVGASAGEILIKHLSHEADCSGIPEPFCSVIKKAMAKDPAQRYATVQEMVEAVFGAEHVRNSVSQFSPQDLTMVAGRVAGRIATEAPSPTPGIAVANGGSSVTRPTGLGSPPLGMAPMGRPVLSPPPLGQPAVGGRFAETPATAPENNRLASSLFAPLEDTVPPSDPYTLKHRLFLGGLATVAIAIAAQAFGSSLYGPPAFLFTLAAIVGASLAVTVSARGWLPNPVNGHRWADRFSLAAIGALAALVFAAPIWLDSARNHGGMRETFFALLFAFAIGNPRQWTKSDRKQRISFGYAAAAAAIAFAGVSVFGGNGSQAVGIAVQAIAVAGGTALVVQVLTPWNARSAAARAASGADDEDGAGMFTPTSQIYVRTPGAPPVLGPIPALPQWVGAAPAGGHPRRQAGSRLAPGYKPVPRAFTAFWFCAMIGFGIIGLLINIVAGAQNHPTNDFALLLAWAFAMYVLAISSFRRLRQTVFRTWPEYVILPVARTLCLTLIVGCCTYAAAGNLYSRDEEAVVVTCVVFGMLWAMTWAVPWLWRSIVPSPVIATPPPLPFASSAPTGSPQGSPSPEALHAPAQEGQLPGSSPAMSWESTRPGAQMDYSTATRERLSASKPQPNVRREPRDILGGFAAFTSALLLAAGFLVAVFLAADVPGMLANGVPDPSLSQTIARDVFGGTVFNWPALMYRLMFVVAGALFVLSIISLIVARRRSGGSHMLRAIVGVAVLIVSFIPFAQEIASRDPWGKLAMTAGLSPRWWNIVEALLDCLRTPGVLVFLILFVASIVLLVWPVRRPRTPEEAMAV